MLHATNPHDDDMRSAVVTLLARAESLDHGARTTHPMVANAYRRRAAELKFAAWLGALKTGPRLGRRRAARRDVRRRGLRSPPAAPPSSTYITKGPASPGGALRRARPRTGPARPKNS